MSVLDVPRETADCLPVAYRRGFMPDPVLSISEWADQNRFLDSRSAAEAGAYRSSRTPYLVEIMDALGSRSPVSEVVVVKGSQVGFTEAGNNAIGYWMEHAPGPILYVQPRREDAQKYSRQRIAPMIETSPVLRRLVQPARARDSGNTVLTKDFPGGFLAMVGANSPSALASMPARYVFMDEIDRYPGDVGGEGDPVALAEARTSTFQAIRKVLKGGTPTIVGISRILREFEKTDQRYYHVPCPRCRHAAPIFWNRIPKPLLGSKPFLVRWPEDTPERAHLVCGGCGAEIDEGKKGEMLAGGRWVQSAKSASGARGYCISALYSPPGWKSWGAAAKQFLKAKRVGGPLELQAFVNTVLGEGWEEPGDAVEVDPLMARREVYSAGVPAGALMLTAGVDVQQDRIEGEIVAWAEGDESWSVDYRIFAGPPESDGVWRQLDDWLLEPRAHESGLKMHVVGACVDSGNWTQRVYEFARPRAPRRVWAVKGRGGAGEQIARASRVKAGPGRAPLTILIVGADTAKRHVISWLGIPRPGPGYCHFPAGRPEYDEEHFAQLTAERWVQRTSSWEKTRERNEALDCRVYALAARVAVNPSWSALRARFEAAVAKLGAEPVAAGDEDEEPMAVRERRNLRKIVAARRRSGSWRDRWR